MADELKPEQLKQLLAHEQEHLAIQKRKAEEEAKNIAKLKELLANQQEYNRLLKELEGIDSNKNFQAAEALNKKLGEIDKQLLDIATKDPFENQKKSFDQFKEGLKEIKFDDFSKGLENMSLAGLNALRTKLIEFMSSKDISIDTDQIRTLVAKFNELESEISKRSAFTEMKDGYENYRSSLQEVIQAQTELNELQKNGSATAEQLNKATANLAKAEKKRGESIKALTGSINGMGKNGKTLVDAGTDVTGALSSVGVKTPKGVSKTLSGLGSVMDGLSSVNLSNPLSMIKGATSVISGLGKLFGGGASKAVKDTEQLQEITAKNKETNAAINKLIAERTKLMKELAGAEAKVKYEEIQTGVKDQEKFQQQQFDKLMKNEIFQKKGKNNNLTLKALMDELGFSTLEEFTGWWNNGGYRDYIMDGYNLKNEAEWEAIAKGWTDLGNSAKEAEKAMKEAATGTTFDALKNSLDDIVWSTDMAFEKVTESFDKHMTGAIKNVIKKTFLDKELQKWYDDFAKAMEDDKLTEEEANSLRAEYERIAKEANDKYNEAVATAGVATSKQTTASENSLSGAYAKASQESIDLLAGQTGAQRIAVENILGHMQFIRELQAKGWSEVTAIRELSAQVNLNTAQTAQNTAQITTISESIANNTKRSAEAMEGMDARGIKVKMS